jgi:PAS domain S-box-containing protein
MALTRPGCQSVLNLPLTQALDLPGPNADLFTQFQSDFVTESSWKNEFMLKKRDGASASFEVIITSVNNESGTPSHFIIVFHDLTQRKQAESALHRYKLLYQRSNDIILISLPDGQIVEANPAAETAYGCTREQLLTMNVNQLFEPQPDTKNSPHTPVSFTAAETEHRRRDGSTFPVEVSSASAFIEEKTVIFSTIRDISDRKQAELHKLQAKETLAQAEKLASLGRMAASISHEINQPLNSIKIITDSIQYWHRKGIYTETADLLNAIGNISLQADQIDKVIKHVRAFLHGKNSSSLAPCNLNSIIESALGFLEAQLQNGGIDLRRNLAGDLPPVLATPTGLEEIIINLVINACHALQTTRQKDKHIILSTSFDTSIVIEVSDNGPGIADAIKDQIFEPFFSTVESEGMGLGLAIVKSIITSYGGRIDALTNAQGGATFRVELPIWQPQIEEEMQ